METQHDILKIRHMQAHSEVKLMKATIQMLGHCTDLISAMINDLSIFFIRLLFSLKLVSNVE